MKNFIKVKREILLKLTTSCITLFLTMISFLLIFTHRVNSGFFFGMVLLSAIFFIFTLVNLRISLGSLDKLNNQFSRRESVFEKISDISSQGIFLTNSDGIIRDLNIKAQSWFFEDKKNITGKSIFRNIDCNLKNSRKTRTVFFNNMGSHFQADIQIRVIEKDSYVIFVEDQTERVNEEKILKKMASEDPLTGLLNRRSFLLELEKEVERSSRIGLSCTIAMLDLDHFKNINDTFGHDFGDEVLKVFAFILKNNSRQLDILCRYGGEEFVLLFPHTDLESSLIVLERVRIEFADHLYSCNIRPTFSGGAINAELKEGIIDVDRLLKEVDRLLYLAKENGRNRIETDTAHKIKLIRVS